MTSTGTREYFAPIDGVRALSVFGVLAYHAAVITSALSLNFAGPLLGRLSGCVALFFSISGFVLYRPMLVAQRRGLGPIDPRPFWARRLVRVVPAYWLVFGICFLWPYLREGYDGMRLADADDLWRYLGLTQVYSARTAPLGFGHVWTLCVELPFYALLPLYARRAARVASDHRVRFETTVLLSLGLTSVVLRAVTHASGDGYPFNLTLAGNVLWLVGGMLLAVLTVFSPNARILRSARRHPGMWLGGAAAVYFASTRLGLPHDITLPYSEFGWSAEHVLLWAVAMLVLTPIAAGATGRAMRALTLRPLRELSEISYEFYLWHLPLLFVMTRLGVVRSFPGSPFLALVLSTAAASAALAAVTHYGVARPLMRGWARRTRRAAPSQLVGAAPGPPPP